MIEIYRRRCYLWSISKHPIGSRFSKDNWFLYLCRFGLMELNDFLLRQYLFNTIKILYTTEISYTSSTHESNWSRCIDQKFLMPVNRVDSWYVGFSRYMYRPKWYMKIPGDIYLDFIMPIFYRKKIYNYDWNFSAGIFIEVILDNHLI